MNFTQDTLYDEDDMDVLDSAYEEDDYAEDYDNKQADEPQFTPEEIEEIERRAAMELDGATDYGADEDGTIVSGDILSESRRLNSNDSSFLDNEGNLVVMDRMEDDYSAKDAFEVKVLQLTSIVSISKRLRGNDALAITGLKDSIEKTGVLTPIIVAPTATEGYYVLVDGYRRVMASIKAKKATIPAIIVNNIKTAEIPILEAMYNHQKPYTMSEKIKALDDFEKEYGVLNPSMLEYLLQLENGDVPKLKDILNDNDPDIVEKLKLGVWTIQEAFKKLEQRRKKETQEEKDIRQTEKINEDESGTLEKIGRVDKVDDEEDVELTEEDMKELSIINANQIHEGLEEQSLEDMVAEGEQIEGFEPHQQKVGEREFIDPALKKAALARDEFTCCCCGKKGQVYVQSLDAHHIQPVFLGGKDELANIATICILCHNMVHTYANGQLYLPEPKTEEEISKMDEMERVLYKDEQRTLKSIVHLGQQIRKCAAKKGMKRKELQQKAPAHKVGRRIAGTPQKEA